MSDPNQWHPAWAQTQGAQADPPRWDPGTPPPAAAPQWGQATPPPTDPADAGWQPAPTTDWSTGSTGSAWSATGSGPPAAFAPPPTSSTNGAAIALIVGGVILAVIVAAGVWFVAAVGDAVPGGLDSLTGELLPGHTYGDNPALDGLWDRCAAAEYGACDQLFFISEVGSEYEYFGDSCGRRNEPAGLCTSIYGE
ncbi:MAG TPA: hypothetical protein VMM13_20575 [Euzebya sp.]|nr:hypothetical protein [Euzebya sp.]